MKLRPYCWIAGPGEESVLQYLGPGFLYDGESLNIEICLFLVCFGINVSWKEK